MIPYSKISRWLSFAIDTITVEDWVGNREVFGPALAEGSGGQSQEELEEAYQIEKFLELEPNNTIVDQKDFLILVPTENKNCDLSITYIGAKAEKIKINAFEVKKIPLDPTRSLKIEMGKLVWTGAGKKLLFVAN